MSLLLQRPIGRRARGGVRATVAMGSRSGGRASVAAGSRGRLAAGVAVVALVVAGCGGGSAPGHRASPSSPRVVAPRAAVRLTLGAPARPIPRGFLGLSIEFQAVRVYTGDTPAAVNPVLRALIADLSPGQAPVLRIGGDSTDVSWVPAPGVAPPRFAAYRLTPSWLASTAALAHDLGAHMILGLNLAADEPALATAQARAYLRAFGRGSIAALEIGNEPNLYATVAQFRTRAGRAVTPRARTFGPAQYRREFAAVVAALPRADPPLALAGPALAAGLTAGGAGPWTAAIPAFLRSEPTVSQLTVHRYPLKNCYTKPGSPQYPTIAHLLAPYSSVRLAAGVRRWVAIAHAQGRRLRVDELNSAACRGRPGVSDTFASALWVTNALFSLAAAGVDGVNLHTLPAPYELFAFSHRGGRWRARVRPVYYGLRLFAAAAPAGSRLLSVDGTRRVPGLSAWATRGADGAERLVLVDTDPRHAATVAVPAPRGTRGTVTVERLRAPGLRATSGVTLGGRGYGESTATGTLPPPLTTPAPRTRGGDVVVSVPGASAALVTFAAR